MKKKKRKTMRRHLSLFLAAAMLMTMQGLPALAETAGETADAARAGVSPSNPVHHCTKQDDGSDTTDWSYVYFGSYPQTEVAGDALTSAITGASYDADGDAWVNGTKYRRISKSDTNYNGNFGDSAYRYFKWERIKWRVMKNDGNTLFVVADKGLDCKDYNEEYTSVTWENCTLRQWLNHDFYGKAFSGNEQGAIVPQTVVNEDNPFYNTEGGNDTTDKVFALSIGEVTNPDYGFCEDYNTDSVSRRMQASDYAHARGALVSTSNSYADNCWWWLRSPGYSTRDAASVDYDGYVNRIGNNVYRSLDACVPALHLNLSSDLWSVADDGSSGEGGNGGTGEDPITPAGSGIQCGSSCAVELGHASYVAIQAYGHDRESLKEIADSATWESQDPTVATVKSSGFILASSPRTYQSENGSYEVWDGSGFLLVTGVAEGVTTITGKASDGSSVSCKVTVEAKADDTAGNGSGSGGSLTLGEDASGTAGGGVAQFFPDTWSLKSAVFPVEISRTEGENGSYTIKGAIGVGKSNWLDDSSKWNKFKSNVNDAQKYTGRVDCLNSYKDTWGVKSLTAVETSKFEMLPKLSVMGYFENTYDKNGNLISQTGKLAADAKWSGSISWQFITPIGPLYLNLEGSGKLSGKLGPKYDYKTKTVQIADGSLKFTPAVALEGGYGIDKAATVGAQGELSLPITIIPATKGEFEAKASLHVKLVFVIDFKHELATYKTTLWDTSKNKKAGGVDALGLSLSEGALSEMDTSFARYESAWHGTGRQAEGIERVGTSEDTETMLQDGILPSSLPMQAEIDGKRVMVFQSYESSRDTLNSSVLKYSVCENGAWSAPLPVWDNGCCDMYADMKVVNGKLVLAWQKEKKEVTGNLDTDSSAVLQEIAKNSEICYAEFDGNTNTFTNQTYVTDVICCEL